MKKVLRKEILDARKSMDPLDVSSKSDSIMASLLETDFYRGSSVIMAYIDFRNEVQTERLIKKAVADGKRVVVPISVVETRQLILSEIIDYDNELESGAYGILEPKPEFIREVDPLLIDLVLVPGVAFDKSGFRIGYGAGYYDRFLERVRPSIPKVALAFELQMVEDACPDEHDFPVEYVITEDTVITCKK